MCNTRDCTYLYIINSYNINLPQVEGIENEAEVIKDLYELIEKYQVPVPPEDLAIYSTLKPAVQAVRSSVDRVVSSREQYIDKFCRNLDRDITDLGKEVKDIKNEAQVKRYTM